MKRSPCVAGAGVFCVWLVVSGRWPVAAAGAVAQTPTIAAQTPSLLDQYCVGCHNDRLKTAGMSLEHADLGNVASRAEVWEKVVQKLRSGMMPPAGRPRPDAAAAHALAGRLEDALDRAEAARPDPGGPLLHRLNRAEYANAIRDLLALDIDAAALLPPDDSSAGFDNVADALGVSPALMERYLSAADQVSALAVGDPAILPASFTYHVRGDTSQSDHVEGLPLGTRGGLMARPTLPLDGEYVIKVKLLQTNLGSVRGLEYAQQLEILVDGVRVHLVPMGGPADFAILPENAEEIAEALDARLVVRVPIAAGPHDVAATFIRRTDAQGGHRLQPFLRSNVDATDHTGLPHIESFTITGPFGTTRTGDTPSRRQVFACHPGTVPLSRRPASANATAVRRSSSEGGRSPEGDASEGGCAVRTIAALARRAYRRPVSDADMARLMRLYDSGRREGGTFEAGVQFALRGILASAKFVFRGERDGSTAADRRVHPVSDIELASRMSFFLWSSIPDDELLSVAGQGRLKDTAVLEQQVRRMLADPRSRALVDNFAGQWLYLRNLRSAQPDQNEFPDFDDNLRQAFQREAELFFESVLREQRSALDLLTGDYTFVNERLARHYGMPNVYGSRFRRVAVTDDARKGLLGKGAILLVTSHAGRTSPVVRGKWVLDNLLGTPPPPPPPDVPALEEKNGTAEPHSVRERLERHRASPACSGCHKLMDPLGLALENFDAVGAWRTTDEGSPIDASGQLVDGTRVDGVVTLRRAILSRPELFVRTLTSKLLVYALGRGLSYHDMPVVRGIVRDAAADDYRLSSLILGIVRSRPFQMRGGGGLD